MATARKPSHSDHPSAPPEQRYDKPVGRIDRDTFKQHLNSPEVQDTLEYARTLWREIYGREPGQIRPVQ